MGKIDKGAKKDHEKDQVFKMVALPHSLATKTCGVVRIRAPSVCAGLNVHAEKTSTSWVECVSPSIFGQPHTSVGPTWVQPPLSINILTIGVRKWGAASASTLVSPRDDTTRVTSC